MAKTYQLHDLSIDRRLVLKSAAKSLQREFAGTFGVETIERSLDASDEEFAGTAAALRVSRVRSPARDRPRLGFRECTWPFRTRPLTG